MKITLRMRKKVVFIVIVLSTVIWIHWSAEKEFNYSVKLLRKRIFFTKDVLIEPLNKTCTASFDEPAEQTPKEYYNFLGNHVDPPSLVIIVTSYVGHVELRSAHRRAMPTKYLEEFNMTRIFLLAKIPAKERMITQASIEDESNRFGDILQGSFIENYRNLTYKHLMGLEWAATQCHKSSFILKVDDDTVFNLAKTHELLQNLTNIDTNNFIMGYMLNQTLPKRSKQNKWYVTWNEYARNNYPPYVSGWYYITTPNVAARICDEAVDHPYFWIDDILVTGILPEALDIKLRQLPEKYWLEYYELLECCLRDMVAKFIRCDYAVGPNGGRNNLIYEFNEALKNCGVWKNCTVRTDNLNKACVAFRERTLFSAGQPEVHVIKL